MRKRKPQVYVPPLAILVETTADANRDRPIFLEDARKFYARGVLCLIDTGDRLPTYAMPRTIEQILANTNPPFPNEVMLASRAAQDLLHQANIVYWKQ